MRLAHGLPVPEDPPLPPALALIGAGAALVISFGVLSRWWRAPRLTASAGRPLPATPARLMDSSVLRHGLRAGALLTAAAVCVIGMLGPPSGRDNLAPTVLYAVFWVGLGPVSLLLGPVWRVANPLRLAHAGLARVCRVDPASGLLPLPERLRYWPAAASLLAFGWLELAHPRGHEPATVAQFLLSYAAAHTGAAVAFGRTWFDHGDGFEVYSTLLGSLAPFGRREDGVLVARNPLAGLAAMPSAAGVTAVLLVLVGSTAYDGLAAADVRWWTRFNAALDLGDPIYLPALDPADGTQGLLVAVLLVTATFLLGTQALGHRHAFARMLVPIAAGYLIAHYSSLLVLGVQRTLILASDPFGTGLDLLATAAHTVDPMPVGATGLALVQVGAIVIGHLVAAVCAHDQATALHPPVRAVRAQYPLLAAMVVLTVGAVALLAEA